MTPPTIGSHYVVNGKIYSSKINAVLAAGLTGADIEWNFFNEAFSKEDWFLEPEESLETLYAKRAAQIRQEYDYVVILCSGGADSTNVVKTFLNNGIRVDEIIASAPLSGLSGFSFNDKDTTHSNTMSETKYAQMPLMQEISQQHPNVKITLHDYFTDILEYDTDEWLLRCDDWIHPSSAARYRFERQAHLVKLADSGKKIAFIYGIDKPVLVKFHNQFHIVFSDLAVNVARPPFDRDYPNVDNVMFYWDAACIQLLKKQAHATARYIMAPENAQVRGLVNDMDQRAPETFAAGRHRHSKYERAIVPAIYAATHRPVFQAEKPTKLFLGEHDDWFYQKHGSLRSCEMIVSDTSSFFKGIDAKYVNSGGNGFRIFSTSYSIGHVLSFATKT